MVRYGSLRFAMVRESWGTVVNRSEVVGRPFAVGSYDLVDTLARCCSGTGLSSEGAGRQLDELGYFVGREL